MSSHTSGKLSQSLTLKRVQSWTNYPSRHYCGRSIESDWTSRTLLVWGTFPFRGKVRQQIYVLRSPALHP